MIYSRVDYKFIIIIISNTAIDWTALSATVSRPVSLEPV
jgi:hypothetical protein